jgi:hypothetical protein
MKQDVTPIHVGKDVHQQVKVLAAQEGVSIRDWVEWALNNSFGKRYNALIDSKTPQRRKSKMRKGEPC